MTAVVFPQEAVVQYVKDLLRIAGLATRDASTLTRQAASLMNDCRHGLVMGVSENTQSNANNLEPPKY